MIRASAAVAALLRRATDGGARLVLDRAWPAGPRAVAPRTATAGADAVVWACGAGSGALWPALAPVRPSWQDVLHWTAPPAWREGPVWVDERVGDLRSPRRSTDSAAVAGLALGMLQSEITKLLDGLGLAARAGRAAGAAVPADHGRDDAALARRRRARDGRASCATRRSARPTRPYATTAVCFVVGVIVLVALHGSLRAAFIASLV